MRLFLFAVHFGMGLREGHEKVREGARSRLFLFAVHIGKIRERGTRKSEKGLVRDCSCSLSASARSAREARESQRRGSFETVPVRCPHRQDPRERHEKVREGARLRLFLFVVLIGTTHEKDEGSLRRD